MGVTEVFFILIGDTNITIYVCTLKNDRFSIYVLFPNTSESKIYNDLALVVLIKPVVRGKISALK